jgi:hypothetical protein
LLAQDPLYGIGTKIAGIPHPTDFAKNVPPPPDLLSKLDRGELYKAMLKERAARRELERQYLQLKQEASTPRTLIPHPGADASSSLLTPAQTHQDLIDAYRATQPRALPGFWPLPCPDLKDYPEVNTREDFQVMLTQEWGRLSQQASDREEEWRQRFNEASEKYLDLLNSFQLLDQRLTTVQTSNLGPRPSTSACRSPLSPCSRSSTCQYLPLSFRTPLTSAVRSSPHTQVLKPTPMRRSPAQEPLLTTLDSPFIFLSFFVGERSFSRASHPALNLQSHDRGITSAKWWACHFFATLG